jgi:hypothetical protein
VLPGLSIAALRNEGARVSRGDILAFVDADNELAPGWIGSAIDALSQPSVAAAGAPFDAPPHPTWVQRVYNSLRDHRPGRREARWLASGNLAVRRVFFDKVGGFDQSLTTCEDVDLCYRLRACGLRILSDSRLRSVHHGDPATLRALFWSEFWRGQDNLRVTLRHRPALRDLPGICMSIAVLLSLAAIVGGVVVTPVVGPGWAICGLGGFALIAMLRAAALMKRASIIGPAELLRAVEVAAVYEGARALALVFRVRHRRERL